MESKTNLRPAIESVNYDEAALAELEIDGVDYRLDAGRGSALAISHRPSGSWQWTPVTEGLWDGVRLRAKALDHAVVSKLAEVLSAATRNTE